MSDNDKRGVLPDWSDLDLDWMDELTRTAPGAPPAPGTTPAGPFTGGNVRTSPERPLTGNGAPDPAPVRPVTAETGAPAERPAPEQAARTARSDGQARDRRQGPSPFRARGPACGDARSPRAERPRPADERPGAESPRVRTPRQAVPAARQAAPPGRDGYRPRERRGRGGSRTAVLMVLIAVLVLGMAFAGWRLASIFLNYRRDRSAYEQLADRAIVALAEPEERTGQSADTAQTDPAARTGTRVTSEVPLTVDWEYLRSINSHIAAWLYCPDTVVNYPVVQVDDMEFYLTHGFDGNPNTSGALFADSNSVLGITQSNYIIFGHNMKDDSMFGTFKYYVEKSYYDAHPVMYLLTPNGNYRIDLLCAHLSEATYDHFPGYFSTDADLMSYIGEITSDSFWVNYDAVGTEHQLVTLTTCTTAAGYEDARFVVNGVLVPIQ